MSRRTKVFIIMAFVIVVAPAVVIRGSVALGLVQGLVAVILTVAGWNLGQNDAARP